MRRRQVTPATGAVRRSRRAFIGGAVLGGAAAIVAACSAPAPTPQSAAPTAAAAAAAPAAAASQPTAAAQAAAPAAKPSSVPAAAPSTGAQGATLEVIANSVPGVDKMWEQLNTEYAAKTGNKISVVLVPDPDAESKVLTSMAGRVPMDLVYVHPRFSGTFAAKGAAAPIDPYLQGLSKAEQEDYYYGAYAWFRWDNKQYALPTISAPNVMYYNVDLLQKAGLADPWEVYQKGEWTTAKFDDYVAKLRAGEGADRVYGVEEIARSIRYQVMWLWGNGGDVFNDKITETVLNSDAAIKGWEYLAGLVTKRLAPSRAESSALRNTVGILNSGRAAMAWSWRTAVVGLKPEIKWGIVPLHKMPDGKEYNRNGPNGLGITSWSKDGGKAWDLLRFVSTRGVEVFTAGQISIPTTRSLAGSKVWHDTLAPWERPEVYDLAYKQIESRPTMPFPPGFSNIDTLVQSAYDRVVLGEASARQAMTEVKPKVDAVLKEMAVK
jgi:multiple sugar transport system substrate-binding protein